MITPPAWNPINASLSTPVCVEMVSGASLCEALGDIQFGVDIPDVDSLALDGEFKSQSGYVRGGWEPSEGLVRMSIAVLSATSSSDVYTGFVRDQLREQVKRALRKSFSRSLKIGNRSER
jgi:hypothetical protein